MHVQRLSPRAPAWGELLARVEHDVYHLPRYLEHAAQAGDEPRAYVISEGPWSLFVPLLLRPLPSGVGRDASSPYGYPGPLVGSRGPEAAPPSFLARAARALVEAMANDELVSAFVRLHPLLGPDPRALAEVGALVHHGPTVWIDLTQDPATRARETRPTTRNLVRRLARDGFRAHFDASARALAIFAELHAETMRRVDAAAMYELPRAELTALAAALGEHLTVCVVERGGAPACAGLFLTCGSVAQYHLSGVAEAFVQASPTRLMLHEASAWARARGVRALHLGGGVGAREDSLFRFKAGLSRQRAAMHTWRLIPSPERYAALTAEADARDGPVDARRWGAFFPAYRRPSSPS
ncbi:MAG: GNAT family N-acetyltransferase [Myxococcales bacterium]|nr:GNAT family N-acetyltransferase [Myxococcales bacterium]